MGNGTRLAIAILILFAAMVAFFFAFHPHGVQNVTYGPSALQWIMGQFDNTSSGANDPSNPASNTDPPPEKNFGGGTFAGPGTGTKKSDLGGTSFS
jgi:hypothetical protein